MADPVEVIKLVNEAAKGVWEVVKDGSPSASAETKYVQVMPSKKQLAWEELSGWQTKSHDWKYRFFTHLDNLLGLDPTIDLDFHLQFDHSGKSSKVPGALFLNNFKVRCRCHVDWGWTVNVNASTTGNPINRGSEEAPIGAIELEVKLDYKSKLQSETETWAFEARANGNLVK